MNKKYLAFAAVTAVSISAVVPNVYAAHEPSPFYGADNQIMDKSIIKINLKILQDSVTEFQSVLSKNKLYSKDFQYSATVYQNIVDEMKKSGVMYVWQEFRLNNLIKNSAHLLENALPLATKNAEMHYFYSVCNILSEKRSEYLNNNANQSTNPYEIYFNQLEEVRYDESATVENKVKVAEKVVAELNLSVKKDAISEETREAYLKILEEQIGLASKEYDLRFRPHYLLILNNLLDQMKITSSYIELELLYNFASNLQGFIEIEPMELNLSRVNLSYEINLFKSQHEANIKTNKLNAADVVKRAEAVVENYSAKLEQFDEVRWAIYETALKLEGKTIPTNPFIRNTSNETTNPTSINLENVELFNTEAVTLEKSTSILKVHTSKASNETPQTITIDAKNQSVTTIKLINSKGEFSVPFKIEKNKIKLVINGEGELILGNGEKSKLTDISKSIFKTHIEKLAERGIVTGYNNLFNPTASATRGEYFSMLARGLGLINVDESNFTDTKGMWYDGPINSLAELGYVQGYNGKSNAKSTITRQEAFTVLGRLLEKNGYKVTSTDLSNYNDANDVASYAKPYIALLNELNIVSGSNGKINPKANITKGEIAKVLSLVLEKLEYL